MKARLSIQNIKGQTKSVDLEKVNVITGRNGAGKSTIMESMMIAIDGEHPTSGKTLAAICSIVSGDSGYVELELTDGDRGIAIRREFINTATKTSQKTFINGKETLQAQAQEKINEFMGGGKLRKISPYKFLLMSPKDRLATLAEIIPSRASGSLDGTVRRALYAGSDEFCGISRYSLEKPVDELSDAEAEEVARKAKVVDAEYFEAIDKYLVAPKNLTPIEYMELLLETNRADVNTTQSEITRMTKALQTQQDNLGTSIMDVNIDAIDKNIAEAERELRRRSDIAAANGAVAIMKRRLEDAKKDLNYTYKDVMGEKKRLNKILADTEDALGETGSASQYEGLIASLRDKINGAAKANVDVTGIRKQCEAIARSVSDAEGGVHGIKDKERELADKLTVLGAEEKAAKANVAMIKGGECPLCKSAIDATTVKSKYAVEIKKLKDAANTISKEYELLSEKRQKEEKALNDLIAKQSELRLLLIETERSTMTEDDIRVANDTIARYVVAIDKVKARDKHLEASAELQKIQGKEELIKQIDAQIMSAMPSETVTEEELASMEADITALREKRNQATVAKANMDVIAREQIEIDALTRRRSIAKKVGTILRAQKETLYWFIAPISEHIKGNIGHTGVLANDVFGINRNGVTISDKALSGGEKIMFTASTLMSAASLSAGTKIMEIEASELDLNNVKLLAEDAVKSQEDIVLILTHVSVPDIPGVNHIRL